MIIVVTRKWWRFWRRPFQGINPFAWYTVDEVRPRDMLELGRLDRMKDAQEVADSEDWIPGLWIDGYEIPRDGGEGLFQWCWDRGDPDAYSLLGDGFVIDGEEGGVTVPSAAKEAKGAWVRNGNGTYYSLQWFGE